jgi:glycine/D-amino acid oxidase-like deaminating enzyme/nitrite reductase/ring-hydroxylating ferredoxin subunit
MADHPFGTSGGATPLWLGATARPEFAPLTRDLTTDICVVGGGIAGLTTAYLLAEAGRSVVLVEDGRIAGGESGRTTAHLSSALDDGFRRLEKVRGEEGARLAAASHAAAIDEIERLASKLGIECDFQRLNGYLVLGDGDSRDELERELAAAARAGLAVRLSDQAPPAPFQTGPCLEFERQAQFHPLAYLWGLADALAKAGGRVYERTRVRDIEDQAPFRVTTDWGHKVLAKTLVIATNAPITSRVMIPIKQAAYRSYVIAAQVPAGSIQPALYWDTADPYHYARIHPGQAEFDYLIVGGEDHKTGQKNDAEARYAALDKWMRDRFQAGLTECRWSGQIMETGDGLAFIGRQEEEIYIATGDSGHGMTHGTIAGMLLRDLILGRPNPWADLYSPWRLPLGSIPELLRETMNFVPRYGMWLTPGEVRSFDEVPPGEGRVLRDGMRKIACYRNEEGRMHACSAVCPHLGCVVAWNDGEKTWDCPCHGSRFDALGRVLNGPANRDLKSMDRPAEGEGRAEPAA